MKRETRLYNILFPLWLIVWFPTWLWLILIPLNYLIDHFVLLGSLKGMENRKYFARDYAWKVCIVGFLCDFVGSGILLGIMLLFDRSDIRPETTAALNMNPFRDIPALLITVFAVAVSGILIFLIDRKILVKCGTDREQAKRSAIWLGILTAPYLFLVPSQIIY